MSDRYAAVGQELDAWRTPHEIKPQKTKLKNPLKAGMGIVYAHGKCGMFTFSEFQLEPKIKHVKRESISGGIPFYGSYINGLSLKISGFYPKDVSYLADVFSGGFFDLALIGPNGQVFCLGDCAIQDSFETGETKEHARENIKISATNQVATPNQLKRYVDDGNFYLMPERGCRIDWVLKELSND